MNSLEHLLSNIASFKGAIAECGVYNGYTLLGMAHILKKRKLKTKIYGLDSFRGLPAPKMEDQLKNGSFHEYSQEGVFKEASYTKLVTKIRFYGFSDQVTIIPGYFNEVLPILADEKFHLVHFDCDLYESYKTCLNFFYPRLVAGGYFVFDQYSNTNEIYPGPQKAIDDFFSNKPEKVQILKLKKHPRFIIQKQ